MAAAGRPDSAAGQAPADNLPPMLLLPRLAARASILPLLAAALHKPPCPALAVAAVVAVAHAHHHPAVLTWQPAGPGNPSHPAAAAEAGLHSRVVCRTPAAACTQQHPDQAPR